MSKRSVAILCLTFSVVQGERPAHLRAARAGVDAVNRLDVDAASKLPREDVISLVDRGMETADGHASDMYQAAMDTHARVTESMQQSTQSGEMVSMDVITELNTAIGKSANAKDLQAMVTSHKALIDKFMEAIDDFHDIEADMTTVREQLSDEHNAQMATNQAAHEAAVKKLNDALNTLKKSHQEKEIATLSEILENYDRIHASAIEIKGKDESLNGAGSLQVHPQVHDGKVAIHDWTNTELNPTCHEYMESTDPDILAIIAGLTQAKCSRDDGAIKKNLSADICNPCKSFKGKSETTCGITNGKGDNRDGEDNAQCWMYCKPDSLKDYERRGFLLELNDLCRAIIEALRSKNEASEETAPAITTATTTAIKKTVDEIIDEAETPDDFGEEKDSEDLDLELEDEDEDADMSIRGRDEGSEDDINNQTIVTPNTTMKPEDVVNQAVDMLISQGFLQCDKVCKQKTDKQPICRMSKWGSFKHFFSHMREVVSKKQGPKILTAFCNKNCGARTKTVTSSSWLWGKSSKIVTFCSSTCAPDRESKPGSCV
jgi:hypothetical protein